MRKYVPCGMIKTQTLRSSKISNMHYGLKYFPLLNPSQIAPKFNSLVEQCRTKIQIQLEAGHGWEGFHVKICLQKSVETE